MAKSTTYNLKQVKLMFGFFSLNHAKSTNVLMNDDII